MNSTKSIENPKDFDRELKLVEWFNSLDKQDVKLINYENIPVTVTKNEKSVNLEINTRLHHLDSQTDIPSIIMDDTIYEMKKLDYFSSRAEINVSSGAGVTTTYDISTLQSVRFNIKGGYRTFYPVDLSDTHGFNTEFETVTHQRKGIDYFYDCLRISIQGATYDITQLKTESGGYYIFECLHEESFENHLQFCFSIRQAIGFINKLMVGDEEYTFDETGNLHYSNYIRSTVRGMYNPITTNPYSFGDIDRNIADKFYPELKGISSEDLSNLVSKIHTNSDLSVAILVILEATSARSLLVIPGSFAIIIELLSKALSIEQTGSENPIEDKNLAKRVIAELHDVIDKNSDSLSNESILKLKRRLNEVNKPTNGQRLTNNEKLTRPFEQLGIKLSLHDIKIIEHRNDLLHGNILLKNGDDRQSLDSINLYMAYVSAKLYTLISKLILKSIGYNGYVYNNAKYLEKHLNEYTEEEYFVKI